MFSTDVAVRWSDMDAYGHVNNARVVTARTQLAAYDVGAQRLRRLMPVEREFLAAFRDGGGGG